MTQEMPILRGIPAMILRFIRTTYDQVLIRLRARPIVCLRLWLKAEFVSGRGAARSGAPLIRDLFRFGVRNGPGSAAHCLLRSRCVAPGTRSHQLRRLLAACDRPLVEFGIHPARYALRVERL